MDNSLRDPTQKLADHSCLKLFRNTIKRLLDNMATKGIHAQSHCVSTDSVGNALDLVRGTMFEATLNQKVSKAVDHELVGLCNDSIHDSMLLIRGTNLQLLLKKDRGLLVVVANNFVHNVLPVAIDAAFEQTSVVKGFDGRDISLTRLSGALGLEKRLATAKDATGGSKYRNVRAPHICGSYSIEAISSGGCKRRTDRAGVERGGR
jgi:hypothetical protein